MGNGGKLELSKRPGGALDTLPVAGFKSTPEAFDANDLPVAFAGIEFPALVGCAAMFFADASSPPFGTTVLFDSTTGSPFGIDFEGGGMAHCTFCEVAAAFAVSAPPLPGSPNIGWDEKHLLSALPCLHQGELQTASHRPNRSRGLTRDIDQGESSPSWIPLHWSSFSDFVVLARSAMTYPPLTGHFQQGLRSNSHNPSWFNIIFGCDNFGCNNLTSSISRSCSSTTWFDVSRGVEQHPQQTSGAQVASKRNGNNSKGPASSAVVMTARIIICGHITSRLSSLSSSTSEAFWELAVCVEGSRLQNSYWLEAESLTPFLLPKRLSCTRLRVPPIALHVSCYTCHS